MDKDKIVEAFYKIAKKLYLSPLIKKVYPKDTLLSMSAATAKPFGYASDEIPKHLKRIGEITKHKITKKQWMENRKSSLDEVKGLIKEHFNKKKPLMTSKKNYDASIKSHDVHIKSQFKAIKKIKT